MKLPGHASRIFLFLSFAAGLLAARAAGFHYPPSASQDENVLRCNKSSNPNDRIEACTVIIQRASRAEGDVAAFYEGPLDDESDAAVNFNFNSGSLITSGRAIRAEINSEMTADEASQFNHPLIAKALNNRGNAYKEKRQLGHAIRDYTQAITTDQGNAAPFYNRATVYDMLGRYSDAIKDYSRYLQAQHRNPDAWSNLCWDRAITGNLRPALNDCNRALQLRPNDADTLDSRGFVYLKMNQFDLAITNYEASLKQYPRVAGPLYGRGLAKLAQGDTRGGNADIVKAKKLDPGIAKEFLQYGWKPPVARSASTKMAPAKPVSAKIDE